jgi:hypothetical protein
VIEVDDIDIPGLPEFPDDGEADYAPPVTSADPDAIIDAHVDSYIDSHIVPDEDEA